MSEIFFNEKRLRVTDLERQMLKRQENLIFPLSSFREERRQNLTVERRESISRVNPRHIFEERLNTINIIQPRETITRREQDLLILRPEREPRERLGDALREFAGLYPTVPQVTVPMTLDQRQVTRIADAIDGLAVVRRAFSELPEDELTALVGKVEGSLSDSTGQERARLVRALFSVSESRHFTSGILGAGLRLDQLPDLILDEGIFSLVSAMLAHPDKYRMQLGVILSQVNLDQMPEELKERLKPHMSGFEFSVETGHGNWYLCGEAEPRLAQSVREGAVMVVGEEDNPYFLVKFRGKLSALCLQDVITKDGKVFVSGNWYSPSDGETQDALKAAFDAGQGKAGLQKGSWALMRPVKSHGGKTAEELVDDALQLARSIPAVYPSTEIVVDGIRIQRQDYRQLYKEEG